MSTLATWTHSKPLSPEHHFRRYPQAWLSLVDSDSAPELNVEMTETIIEPVTASTLLRSTRASPASRSNERDPHAVLLRRGHFLRLSTIPQEAARWKVRREISIARSLAVMLDQPSVHTRSTSVGDIDQPIAALTMDAALAIRGIESWLNVPDVHYWPPVAGSRTILKKLPEVEVHGHKVPVSNVRRLAGIRLRADTEMVRGVPVVSIEEAMLDLARYAHPLQAWVGCSMALRAIAPFDPRDSAESRRQADKVKLGLLEEVSRKIAKRQSRRAQDIIRGIDSGTQNSGEAALYWLTSVVLRGDESSASRPVPQMSVSTPGGRFFLDIGFPEIGLGLEMDGRTKLSIGADALGSWMDRQHALLRAGWKLVRYPYSSLSDPEGLAHLLAADLSEHGLRAQAPGGPMWRPVSSYLLAPERRF